MRCYLYFAHGQLPCQQHEPWKLHDVNVIRVAFRSRSFSRSHELPLYSLKRSSYAYPQTLLFFQNNQNHGNIVIMGQYDQGAPPQYPQSPAPIHHDAGPAPQNGYYYNNNGGGDPSYYNGSPNPYQQAGPPQGQYGAPQGYQQPGGYGQQPQMQYQQGPPQGGYYGDGRGKSGGGGGLFAGLCAGLACCCCLDCLF
ncbi:hypothetical protein J1614_001459 [Plenodomus biglobosus]|nr:hypothetical protein J1614_001459 [Plenodomus biglobosus]